MFEVVKSTVVRANVTLSKCVCRLKAKILSTLSKSCGIVNRACEAAVSMHLAYRALYPNDVDCCRTLLAYLSLNN